ncbi:MAG: ankyrin repeat-containing protein [Pedosphaera sp.]|nr:ankyrin repeat-containing protein [Pedosphaera sp.]
MAIKKKRFSKLQWFGAVQDGDLPRVRALIKEGINVDLHGDDIRGATALMRGGLADAVELMELLIKAGADVNAEDNLGSHALEYAAGAGKLKAIKLLLSHGAKIKSADGKESALAAAIESKNAAAALMLLKAGADPRYNDAGGSTVLHEAAKAGLAPVVQYLLKKGADANAVNSNGVTPLIGAAQSNRSDVVDLLLAAGADVKAGNNNALICATTRGSVELCGKLLHAGADVNAEDKWGYDALMAAARCARPELVRFLLESGAKVKPTTIKEAEKVSTVKGAAECIELMKLFKKSGKLPAPKSPPQKKYPAAVMRMMEITKAEPKIPEAGFKGGYWFNTPTEKRAQQIAKQYRDEFVKQGFYPFTHGSSVGLFPNPDKYAAVAAMGTYACDGPDTEELIAWLKKLDKKQPFELLVIGQDCVGGEFRNPVKNAEALVKSMIQICSDLFSSGGTVAALARHIQHTRRFDLWWD